MKLDDFAAEQKLSLDVTPLLDVVFLLVLFFAVTTSFISPRALSELKSNLSGLKQDKQTLEGQVRQYTREVAAKTRQLAGLKQRYRDLTDEYQLTRQKEEAEVAALKHDVVEAQARGQKLQWMIKALEDEKSGLVKTLADSRSHNKSLQQQLEQAYKDFQSVNVKLASAKESAVERARREQEVLTQLAAQVERGDTLKKQVSALRDERSKQDARARLLQALIDERAKEVSALQTKLDDADAARKKLAAALESTKGERDDAASQEKLLRALLAEKVAASAGLAERLAEMGRQRDALDETVVRLQGANQAQRDANAELSSRVGSLQHELAGYRKVADLDRAQLQRLLHAQRNLESGLASYLKQNKIGIKQDHMRLTLKLSDRILFDSGSATLKPGGLAVLRRVGEILKTRAGDLDIQVGGHTDNVPIRAGGDGAFKDNWSLSAGRAVNVVEFLEHKVGVDPKRLSAVGYGEYRPVADNDTPQGRALNRRIEIVLVPH